MNRDQIRTRLQQHQAELRSLAVASLVLFGSVARGEARPESDVDLLVEFDRPVGLFHFLRLQRRLAELLDGAEIDLVLRRALLPELTESVEREAISCL